MTNQLQRDVEDELEWDPKVDARHIIVTAHNGAVTLSGDVPSYVDKLRAVSVVEHVHGVKAIANEVEVRLQHPSASRKDSEIAESIAHVFESSAVLSHSDVQAEVADGRVTLTGTIEWKYQSDEAERMVSSVLGVTTVTNLIALQPRSTLAQAEEQISNELFRNTGLDARQIHVVMCGTTAVLSGQVHSFEEARIARDAAWAAPGVWTVDDHLLAIHP
jgi:osmotically-inducible protein OsmY